MHWSQQLLHWEPSDEIQSHFILFRLLMFTRSDRFHVYTFRSAYMLFITPTFIVQSPSFLTV